MIAAGGAYELAQLNASMDNIVNDKYCKASLVTEISFAAMDNARLVRSMILSTDKDKLDAVKAQYADNLRDNNEIMELAHA